MNSFSLIISFTLFFFSFHSQAHARDYYVSTTGKIDAKGTLKDPMPTIQSAIDSMHSGDTCYIRGGVYHEIVNLNEKRGSRSQPITITNYQDEKVIMDGTKKLEATWKLDKGKIYKTRVTANVTQLFADNKPMTLARLPNAIAFSPAVFNPHVSRIDKDPKSKKNEVIATAKGLALYKKLYKPLNGCVAILNFQDHLTLIKTYTSDKNIVKPIKDSPLKKKTTYYWRVDTTRADETKVTGEIWSFST